MRKGLTQGSIAMFDILLSAVLSLALLGYLLFALLKPERF
ncbi:K(+)-transporting ATPase subunit F [Abditibacterium utsteinense]|nr:K(+)-transporting ATPase subunit F [Abditibacterium utsteinense]